MAHRQQRLRDYGDGCIFSYLWRIASNAWNTAPGGVPHKFKKYASVTVIPPARRPRVSGRNQPPPQPRRHAPQAGTQTQGRYRGPRGKRLPAYPPSSASFSIVYGIGTVRTPAQVRRGIMAARSYLRLKRYWYSAR